MLGQLAQFCFRRRWIVLITWIAVFVGLGAASGTLGSNFRTDFRLPNTESREGFHPPANAHDEQGFPGQIVPHADSGVTHPAVQSAMTAYFTEISTIERS